MVVKLGKKCCTCIYSSSCSCISLTGIFHGLQTATNIGNISNSTVTGRQHQSSPAIPSSSHAPNVIPSPAPALQSALSLPTSTPPLMPLLDVHDSSSNISRATNLVKPSLFAPAPSSSLMMPPLASSMPTAPPLHPPLTMQRPYGTPLLQPFPPPTPPPSLTPTPNYSLVITRDRVQDALLKLVQVCPSALCYL